MSQSYDDADILRWAEFSGDHNPVHFDRDVACKNGLDDIIVQGMLTLQRSKQMLSRQDPFFDRVKYFLKKPVYRHAALAYRVTERKTHTALEIGIEGDTPSITGRTVVGGLDRLLRCKTEIEIDRNFIDTQYMHFRRVYPHIIDPWILLDSFIFSVCFKYQNGDPFYLKSLKIDKEPDKTKVSTFQIDQDICLFPGVHTDLVQDVENLRFFYEDTDLVKQDYAVVSQLTYQVYHKEVPLYQSSMSSLTRALEASRSAREE